MDFGDEHAWVKPMGVISNIRRKRKRALDDSEPAVNNKEGLPDKKKASLDVGRKHSIFTLSSSNVQIAEERCGIKEALSLSRALKEGSTPKEQESPANDNEKWHEQLCVDWSLKTSLRISTKNQFAWSSNNLKSSEESSGTSAFVRCVDIEPLTSAYTMQSQVQNPKLDTSLGAQFHQCCLYWQHPYIPSLSLFPRENKTSSYSTTFTGKLDSGYFSSNSSSSSASILNNSNTRFDEKTLECMQAEWIEALRSSFHLLRLRQSPYFYVCSSVFTCLFCSAGTRDQEIHIYITPSTKGFRDSLKTEGIKFDMPYFNEDKTDSQTQRASPTFAEESSCSKSASTQSASATDDEDEAHMTDKNADRDDDEEPYKWLDDMGISQDVSISNLKTFQSETTSETKLKSTLIIVKGSEALPFFNFLINTRNMLITSSGPLAGIPPTILSPVAFHGATLRSLKVMQKKVKNELGQYFHLIEMNGPILPHVPHMLCGLFSKTVNDYKIRVNTLSSTIPLNNVNLDQTSSHIQNKPNAFALQSLTDCGLTKAILEVFCQCNSNCCTIKEVLHRKNCLFNWH